MDAFTTRNQARVEQCRKNAQVKSDKKRQATLEALATLKKKGVPITKAAVAKQAGVSVVFLRSHPDLVQALADAQKRPAPVPATVSPSETSKDQVIAALRRRVEDLKRELSLKEMAFREKQREIDRSMASWRQQAQATDAEKSKKVHFSTGIRTTGPREGASSCLPELAPCVLFQVRHRCVTSAY